MAYCQPSGVCLTQFCLLTKAITRGWHGDNIYQVRNKSALCIINYKTQQLPNTSTYKPINSKTYQLTTSSTQHPIASPTNKLITNPRTLQLINLQTQKLKLFVLFLQNHSKFHAVLAKIWVEK